VLTTPIAAPVVLISGEPDMPLTVSFGLGPKRAALMATTSSQARSSESRCAGKATSTEGKAAGWSLIARKAYVGRGRRGDVKRRQRLDEGLVLVAFVAKRLVVARAEHRDVSDRVGEIAGGRYAGFRAEQADQEVVR
jgi:hypothetical protein